MTEKQEVNKKAFVKTFLKKTLWVFLGSFFFLGFEVFHIYSIMMVLGISFIWACIKYKKDLKKNS